MKGKRKRESNSSSTVRDGNSFKMNKEDKGFSVKC